MPFRTSAGGADESGSSGSFLPNTSMEKIMQPRSNIMAAFTNLCEIPGYFTPSEAFPHIRRQSRVALRPGAF